MSFLISIFHFIENKFESFFQWVERGGRSSSPRERRNRRRAPRVAKNGQSYAGNGYRDRRRLPPQMQKIEDESHKRVNRFLQVHSADVESVMGFMRLLLAASLLVMFSIMGGYIFEMVDAVTPAENLKMNNFLFKPVPLRLLKNVFYIFNWHNARYMLMPLAAITGIFIGGAYFLTDVYNLPSVRYGLRYILASMLGVKYPKAMVDDGQLQNTGAGRKSQKAANPQPLPNSVQAQREAAGRKAALDPVAETPAATQLSAHQQRRALVDPNKVDEAFLLDEVGGPGFLLIQPGNAVLFRTLRKPMRAGITEGYFLSPFERIGQIANLDDQHGYASEILTVTRDGIPVILREIFFRFRILLTTQGDRPMIRSLENPYPFSAEAMQNMAYNLSVEENGQVSWRASVQRAVIGTITDYFNKHQIDELTAPRQANVNPRQSILDELASQNQRALRRLGAELLWIDIGHFDIVPEEIDQTRVSLWAAEWQGNAQAVLAVSEAKRQAYEEVGRAEAQAELIRSITKALENANLTSGDKEVLRKLILMRTAQILDTMNK